MDTLFESAEDARGALTRDVVRTSLNQPGLGVDKCLTARKRAQALKQVLSK